MFCILLLLLLVSACVYMSSTQTGGNTDIYKFTSISTLNLNDTVTLTGGDTPITLKLIQTVPRIQFKSEAADMCMEFIPNMVYVRVVVDKWGGDTEYSVYTKSYIKKIPDINNGHYNITGVEPPYDMCLSDCSPPTVSSGDITFSTLSEKYYDTNRYKKGWTTGTYIYYSGKLPYVTAKNGINAEHSTQIIKGWDTTGTLDEHIENLSPYKWHLIYARTNSKDWLPLNDILSGLTEVKREPMLPTE